VYIRALIGCFSYTVILLMSKTKMKNEVWYPSGILDYLETGREIGRGG